MAIDLVGNSSATLPALNTRRAEPKAAPESVPSSLFGTAEPPPPAPAPTQVPPVDSTANASLPEPQLQPPRLRIEYNPDVQRYVYKSIEAVTGQVVQQLPTEEALRRLSYLRDIAKKELDKSA